MVKLHPELVVSRLKRWLTAGLTLSGSAFLAISLTISNLMGVKERKLLTQLEMLVDAGCLITESHHSVSNARGASVRSIALKGKKGHEALFLTNVSKKNPSNYKGTNKGTSSSNQ